MRSTKRVIPFKVRFLIWALVFSTSIFFGFQEFKRTETQELIGNFNDVGKERLSHFETTLISVGDASMSDLEIIKNLISFQEMVNDLNEKTIYRLEKDLVEIVEIRKRFDQLRFIDSKGFEILRINRTSKGVALVSKDQLQDKSKRNYFKMIMSLPPEKCYVSRLDLNIEEGQIQLPIKPTIRFGLHIFDQEGKSLGALVLNLLVGPLLSSLQKPEDKIGNFLMVDPQGFFLKGLNSNDEWNFMFPERPQKTFGNQYPLEWKKMAKEDQGSLLTESGLFVFETVAYHSPFYPWNKSLSENSPVLEKITKNPFQWKLIYLIKASDMKTYVSSKSQTLYLWFCVCLLIGFGLAWLLSHYSYTRRQLESQLIQTNHDLENVVVRKLRETQCLYKITKLFAEKGYTIQEILELALEVLPTGFQHPESLLCRISFRDLSFQTNGFRENSPSLMGIISPFSKKEGELLVTYQMDENPSFFHEEHHLVEAFSKLISNAIKMAWEEEKNDQLQTQLTQTQKMESIGHLAGGIAHDFNNLLTVINGYAELGKDSELGEPYGDFFSEILATGERGASLVRQLLIFSRQEPSHPKPELVNTLIKNIEKMLSRLVSEQIKIKLELEPNIPPILVDPTQFDQVIINLVVNARDAILAKPNNQNKSLIISTYVEEIPSEMDHPPQGASTDRYVVIGISDTGIGMTKETQENIFTPFFTTKEIGVGTGLGLATVFGAVTQNNGFIKVYSEIGLGTTFKIFWPAQDGIVPDSLVKEKIKPVTLSQINVLVVEDDEALRTFLCQALQKIGLNPFQVANSEDALIFLKEPKEPIDVLFTDVILPGISGIELQKMVRQQYPRIQVILSSGFNETFFNQSGSISEDFLFLRKPFSVTSLRKVFQKILENSSIDTG